MVELTDAQQKIRTSLITAISNDNLQTVQDIFNNNENEHDDIQAALSHKGTADSNLDTILDFAIVCLKKEVEAQGEIGRSVEIIKRIWQEADRKTRDSVCYRAMDSFQDYEVDNISTLKPVIQEVEEHKRVRGLDSNAPIVTNTTTPTTGNKTPEKNDTNFLSKHKGKIALGVVGLCVVGAIAAYVLAYPVVALVLAVSALAVLAGAYIGGVFENPSAEKTFTSPKEREV
ncbi:hypothetical protein [Wolbachia endosymbiont (group A) of Epistrophe grossularia]|uniref:hypothetical protein n=1 Tax=Wolbachia endosymbiont (group A) of Epistrophe grossularia TaxID=2954008 RepID=UPI0022326911|nr:hypothetical protein [Wolbachia endosymbiont (group A) of Epistrophe grossularia]